MKIIKSKLVLAAAVMLPGVWVQSASGATTYDINTLAGKVASVNGTAGLQIRFSAFIQEESQDASAPGPPLIRSLDSEKTGPSLPADRS